MSNTIDPQDNNEPKAYMGKDYRNSVIKTLPLMKQFTIRQHLNTADSLSREGAIELLKDCIVQLAQKDKIFGDMLKSGM